MEVVEARGDGWGDALVVHLARAVYVLTQPLVDVAFEAALADFLLVVELDLRNEQAGEAARVVVLLSLLVAADFDGQLGGVGRAPAAGRRRGGLRRGGLLRLLVARCRFIRHGRAHAGVVVGRGRRSSLPDESLLAGVFGGRGVRRLCLGLFGRRRFDGRGRRLFALARGPGLLRLRRLLLLRF